MVKLIKCQKVIVEKVVVGKQYSFEEVVKLLVELFIIKFKEFVDVVVNFGVDLCKFDQVVCGVIVLLNGIGKSVCVVVFIQGLVVEVVLVVGVDKVGMDELVVEMKGGDLNYDVVIVFLDVMCVVGQLGQIFGLCGLMLNLKVGIVILDVVIVVKNVKVGQVCFCIDKNGIIYSFVGKVDFELVKLQQNVEVLLVDLKCLKLFLLKGVYVKCVILSIIMGLGLQIDLVFLEV